MKLGVLTALFADKPLNGIIPYLSGLGVQMVEIGTGGFVGNPHCDVEKMLIDPIAREQYSDLLSEYDMGISAFSCHGNPVHPQKELAEQYHKQFENSVILAEKMNVDIVVTFSGCPGTDSGGQYPSWVTCPWPDDFGKVLEYQWEEVLIPYWQKAGKFAADHGIKIALELHPGFCVYNTETLLRLREAVGDVIGANLDMSHLFWQGMEPIHVIRKLGKAIHYFHAKDTKIDIINTQTNGVLDTKHYSDEINRSWIFRTVGYGHGISVWKDIITNLRMAGYDKTISIEHEDSIMSSSEGLEKAVAFLKEVVMFEDKGELYWA